MGGAHGDLLILLSLPGFLLPSQLQGGWCVKRNFFKVFFLPVVSQKMIFFLGYLGRLSSPSFLIFFPGRVSQTEKPRDYYLAQASGTEKYKMAFLHYGQPKNIQSKELTFLCEFLEAHRFF